MSVNITKLRKMKERLKFNSLHTTLGESFLNLKILTKKWLSELSQKFHFLLSFWQPAYFYGQTLTVPPQRKLQVRIHKLQDYVYQAHQFGLNAGKSNDSTTVLGKAITVRRLRSLSDTLNLDWLRLRLFNGLYTFWDNKRLRWGMLLLLIAAPASKFFYLLLPEAGFGDYFINLGPFQIVNTLEVIDGSGWYWLTLYYYFWSVGELLAPLLSIFGIFLLFPKKYYPSYLVGVPFGYYFSMLIHRMFYVYDFESFHGGFTTTMTFSFLLLGIVLFMVSDKVLFRQNHKKRAAEARIIGLINMPGMEWNDKEEIIKKEVAEVMKVDNELFIKESA